MGKRIFYGVMLVIGLAGLALGTEAGELVSNPNPSYAVRELKRCF